MIMIDDAQSLELRILRLALDWRGANECCLGRRKHIYLLRAPLSVMTAGFQL
jgi:hypothetical protein